jgi:hypothetical protein
MKEVLLINGSPKGKKATSHTLLEYIETFIETDNTEVVSISDFKGNKMSDLLAKAASSTDMVISFPLYLDSIPAILQEFMEELTEYRKLNILSDNINLFTIVNCGSPEETQTEVALKIMMCFANRCDLTWQFGIGIGMGCLLNPEVFFPEHMFVKNVYEEIDKIPTIITNLLYPDNDYVLISPKLGFLSGKIARQFYIRKVNSIWKEKVKKNKIIHPIGYQPYSIHML